LIRWLVPLCIASSGCHRAELEHGLTGARNALTVAEPCMVEVRAAELRACSGDASCEAPIKERWGRVADDLDAFRAAWCIIAPNSEGCS